MSGLDCSFLFLIRKIIWLLIDRTKLLKSNWIVVFIRNGWWFFEWFEKWIHFWLQLFLIMTFGFGDNSLEIYRNDKFRTRSKNRDNEDVQWNGTPLSQKSIDDTLYINSLATTLEYLEDHSDFFNYRTTINLFEIYEVSNYRLYHGLLAL